MTAKVPWETLFVDPVGNGVKKSTVISQKWLKKAAQAGHSVAIALTGWTLKGI